MAEELRLAHNDAFSTHWGSTARSPEAWADMVGARSARTDLWRVVREPGGRILAYCSVSQWREGALYVDLNSTAPQVKEAVAAALPGARVVDGVMTGGGIQLDGSRIPISLAGPDAAEAAGLLSGAGFSVAVVGERVGAAAALKMLRSVVVKGLEGLWTEALLAAHEMDVVEPLLAMVEETLDRWPTRDFATMLVTTHVAHAGRRQVEARMVRDTVAGTGVEPFMSAALVARQEHTARGLEQAGRRLGDVPATLAEALEVLRALPR